jgi:tRNA G18 (ribose-2'-O)-methylase SpoU
LTGAALDSLRESLEAVDAPIYLTSHEVARAVVGFDFHRGCVALGERGVEPSLEALMDPPGPRVVLALEDVSNPDNVGGVFRNARAFGADAIFLSAGCADPLYRKAIRTSMGASLVTPFAHLPDWAAALARLRKAGYTLVALTPDPFALDIATLGVGAPIPSRVALLLGAEGPGLSTATLGAADLQMQIAMVPGVDSLNVATAAAIALHHLRSATHPHDVKGSIGRDDV